MCTQLYSEFAKLCQARLTCKETANTLWYEKHTEKIETLCKEYMPSGSGIDRGTKFDFDRSKPNFLVFDFGFHHMDGHGYYDGWTEHKAIVTPSLDYGFNLRITGRDRNQIKDYLHEVYDHALHTEYK